MNAVDAAHEAASLAQAERRRLNRLAREAALAGSVTARAALTEAWEPIRLWQQEIQGYARYERQVPEGVVRND